MNPVVLLDEVDKLGAGAWSGDPTAALLEVLDPAQNHTFRDHYLELDLDLSEVVFIATANVLDTVPGAAARPHGHRPPRRLHRRREGVHRRAATCCRASCSGPGCGDDELTVDDDTMLAVIRGYTREAGVRSLERELGRLARKAAAKIAVRRRQLPALDADAPRTTGSAGPRSSTTCPSAPSCPAWPPAWPSPATAATCCSSRRRRSRVGGDGEPSADAHRSARRRHEGVGADRPQLRAVARRRARRRPRRGAPAVPRPRAGGRRAQGRAVGGRHDDHGAGQPAARPAGQGRRSA